MDQKIFNNIILLIIIAFIIYQVSPEPDSILYVLQKYVNYFVYQFRKILARFNLTTIENFEINKIFEGATFKGMPNFANNTPSFKSSYEVSFVNFYKNKYPNILEKDIYKTYNFLQTLVSIDTDQYFLTPSDHISNKFNDNELEKIKNILLKKLNYNNFNFNFSNFIFEYYPKYYLNSSGKEIDPFVFKIDSPIGNLRVYINIDIRNDVYQNIEYLVINEIKLLKDKQVIFTNQNNAQVFNSQNNAQVFNSQNNAQDFKNSNLMYEFPNDEEPLLYSQMAPNDPEFINYNINYN
jgi:hypothetical protein